MYGKCGFLAENRRVLDEMPPRDVVSWNSMVVGYAQNGSFDDALEAMKHGYFPRVSYQHIGNVLVSEDTRTFPRFRVSISVLHRLEVCKQMNFFCLKPDAWTMASLLSAVTNTCMGNVAFVWNMFLDMGKNKLDPLECEDGCICQELYAYIGHQN
ncbi:unnamed protein product [Cuscuta epithymum]|uniref:Pentatricopeptide repeat-containing protein n=1 Tax=Cuscuta epithymum TaxID=186058 RepID=A0AAV0FMV8_9ASTE|nr:unnamed protein product [Cuscuta epithymum]